MATEELMQDPNIELLEGISVIRSGSSGGSWNGLNYNLGLSSHTVGSTKLSMQVATVPPSGIAKAHIHVGFELGLFILQGRVEHRYGKGLSKSVINEAGDFIFIEPDVPHEVYNLSDSEPIIAVVARSSPHQWDEIIPYDPAEDL
jgi:uncharacterized RmlC-like cupin family protein